MIKAGQASAPFGSPVESHGRVRWTAGREGLSELALEWNQLELGVSNPLQQYVWAHSAATAFANDEDLRVATVWDGQRLAAAAPLVVSRVGGVAQLQLVGAAELCEPMDLLASEAAALDPLTQHLVQLGSPLCLQRLSATSPTIDAMRRACQGKATLEVRPEAGCSFIPLDASWCEPQRHLNFGRQSDLRRAQRRAQSLGGLETEILAPRPSELGELLNLALRIEASGRQEDAGADAAANARRVSFYRRYAAAASRAGRLRLCFLRIGGEPAATQTAVQTNSGFWLLKVGYNPRFSRCSPGTLLLRETIAAAAAAGLTTFEFLGTQQPWTETWTPKVHAQVSLHVSPCRSKGLATLTADTAGRLFSRWRRT